LTYTLLQIYPHKETKQLTQLSYWDCSRPLPRTQKGSVYLRLHFRLLLCASVCTRQLHLGGNRIPSDG